MKSFVFTIAIITIITLTVGFSACERMPQIIQPTTPQTEDKSGEISIGLVLPLTGHLAAAAEQLKDGLDLAFDEINMVSSNNTKFKFIVEDDSSTQKVQSRLSIN